MMTDLTILPKAKPCNQNDYIQTPRYTRFFEATDQIHVGQFAKGSSLEKLVDLVKGLELVTHLSTIKSFQNENLFYFKHLSEIKSRLANAIEMKRAYYDNHPFGIITKYFLMCFGKWNNGDTASIVSAENFLLFWDSRRSLNRISEPAHPFFGKYYLISDQCLIYYKSRFAELEFFNYNPRRQIELITDEKIDLSSLN